MPHSDSSARKHSIAFHSSHHYIYNSCCGWVTNLWKTSNWTGSRRAIPADSCLQHSWQRMANPATPPIFLISLLFLMLCGAFTKKKLPVRTGTSWTQWPMATSKWERGRLIRSCQDSWCDPRLLRRYMWPQTSICHTNIIISFHIHSHIL